MHWRAVPYDNNLSVRMMPNNLSEKLYVLTCIDTLFWFFYPEYHVTCRADRRCYADAAAFSGDFNNGCLSAWRPRFAHDCSKGNTRFILKVKQRLPPTTMRLDSRVASLQQAISSQQSRPVL